MEELTYKDRLRIDRLAACALRNLRIERGDDPRSAPEILLEFATSPTIVAGLSTACLAAAEEITGIASFRL